jgi:hypothetical protein
MHYLWQYIITLFISYCRSSSMAIGINLNILVLRGTTLCSTFVKSVFTTFTSQISRYLLTDILEKRYKLMKFWIMKFPNGNLPGNQLCFPAGKCNYVSSSRVFLTHPSEIWDLPLPLCIKANSQSFVAYLWSRGFILHKIKFSPISKSDSRNPCGLETWDSVFSKTQYHIIVS